MLNIRILGGLWALFNLGTSLWAMESRLTFDQINNNLDEAIKFIQTSDLNPTQLRALGKKLKTLGQALDGSRPEVSENQMDYKNPINVPPHVKSIYKNKNGAQSFISPLKDCTNKNNTNINLKKRPLNLDFDENDANKKLKSELAREKTGFTVYIHSLFNTDYSELYIPKERRIKVNKEWTKLKEENPNAPYEILRKKLMLLVEKNFRQILKEYPGMIRAVIYVGESKNFDARAHGHIGDLRNEEKCLRSTKSKNEKAGLDVGLNLRYNWVIKNLASKEELKLFEALLAQIFPVQLFGASARIGDKKAFKELDDYLSWPERRDELNKAGLLTIVEELKEEAFKSQFSNLFGEKEF